MDEASAKAIRDYVSEGGTVLMTGYSAKENEHAQWFDTTLPGRLSDVFGLRTAAFYRNDSGVNFMIDGKAGSTKASYYEILEPSTAEVLGTITNHYLPESAPFLTMNKFGKGRALYLATESSAEAVGPVLDVVKRAAGIEDGPTTPEGVYAREVDGRTLYINTNYVEARVPITGTKRGLLSNRTYQGELTLPQRGADLVE